MATNNNLQDFLTDIANAIRTKTGTTNPINAQDFSAKISSIQTSGGGNTLKNLLDATKSAKYLFDHYNGTSVDDLIQPNDTENVINMQYMFEGCSKLTTIHQLNTSKVNNMKNMFYDCVSLTSVPQFNTNNVNDMSNMFGWCQKLTVIPQWNVSSVTNMNNMFLGCSSLKSILMTGMQVSFNISASTKFEESDLVTILNNLATVTSTKTLTMGATNLAKLTDEDKAIATNKGWTLA